MTEPSRKTHDERLAHFGPLAVWLLLALATSTGCSQTATPGVFPPLAFMSPAAFFGGQLPDKAGGYLPYFYAAQEGPIADMPSGVERYRFTWLRTFDAPIAVRLDASLDSPPLLIAKVLSGHGGYDPGEIVERKVVSIRQGQWERFQRLLREADFWNDTGHQPEPGLDGGEWILEGAKGTRYHVVARWNALKRKPVFADVCLSMVEMARLNISDNRVY